MSLIKSASTALARHMRNMPTEKLLPFAKEIEQHVKDGKLAKRVFEIKHLGEGATQKADLVMHPTFGLAARKVTHGATLEPSDLALRNNFLRRVSQDDVKSFAKLKGFEHEGDAVRQKTYMEYVPGEHPKSTVGPETWGEIMGKAKKMGIDKPKPIWEVSREQMDYIRYANRHRMSPELGTQMRKDLRKVRRFGLGHDVNDVAVNNIVGDKIVDADTLQRYSNNVPFVDVKGPQARRKRRMQDIFGEKHPFDTKVDEVKPFDPSEKVSRFGPEAPAMAVGIGAAALVTGLSATALGLTAKSIHDHRRHIAKVASIQGGPHSNLPNAWKQKKGMGPNSNIPLAYGLDSSLPPLPKLAGLLRCQ